MIIKPILQFLMEMITKLHLTKWPKLYAKVKSVILTWCLTRLITDNEVRIGCFCLADVSIPKVLDFFFFLMIVETEIYLVLSHGKTYILLSNRS